MSEANIRVARERFNPRVIYQKFGILIILFMMVALAILLSPYFFTTSNLRNILKQIAVDSMVAAGETMLLILGQVDLSAGSVLALAGVIAADVMKKTDNLVLALITGLLVGAATGAVNGFMITRFKLPSFIMTLAMMQIARGLVFVYTKAIPVMTGLGSYILLGQGNLGFLPISVIIMAAVYLIAWYILKYVKFGRYIYAIGGNEEAARASGIRIDRIKLIVFVINGIIVSIAGMVLIARLNSGQPGAGVGYEFDGITAAIIGGTSLSGGAGTMQGTLVGALIIGVLNNILNLTNVNPYFQQLLKGFIIAAAVAIDMRTKMKRK